MIRKGGILLTLFLFALFVVQPSASTQTENEKLVELIERFDKWQGKVEALEAENVELRADNVKLKARFKNLKLKVKSLEKMVQSKGEETCEQVELNNSSSKKKRSVAASSKKSPTTSTSKNSRALTKPLPTSCRDLRAQGHFADGIYLLADLAKNQIMAYFCEFLSAVDIVDTFIGNVQLKEADTVNFFAQKNTSFSNADNTIPFDTAILNVGNAMNTATGVFTAPVAGIYHFEFSGMTSEKLNVILKKNGDDIASTAADFSFWNGNSFYSGISLACSLQLSANDNVSLYLFGPGSLYQNDTVAVPNTHFTGWLVTADAAVLPQGP